MQNKHKALLAVLGCGVGLGIFTLSTSYSNLEAVMQEYRSTTDGSYIQKHQVVDKEIILGKAEDPNQEQGGSGSSVTPIQADATSQEWRQYVNNSKLSETRKKILLEGIDTYEKGALYHQIRSAGDVPTGCIVEKNGGKCDHDLYPGVASYDFSTQANYTVEDPLYLDCSFFVKHCYHAAGLEMKAANTAGMREYDEWVTISPEELVPGDICVTPSHVVIFLGRLDDGTNCFVHMSQHSTDMEIGPYDLNKGTTKRLVTLQNDTKW